MRLKIKQANLAAVLDHIYRVVERKQTIPILGNVCLKADKGRLIARGTDLNIEIVADTGAMVERAGESTVNVHIFNDIIRKHKPETTIILDDNGRVMTMKAGRGTTQLPTLPADHFPAYSLLSGDTHSFSLPAPVLRGLIEPIESAIANETTRTYLTGIHFHLLGDKILRAVATDGYRLGLSQTDAPDGSQEMPGVIVPRKTIGELRRILSDLDTTVAVQLSSQKIQFGIEGVALTSTLLEGEYPDYQRSIPQNDKKLTVDKQELAEAVDRVSTVGIVRRGMKCAIRAGCVELSVQGLDKGMATEEVAVDYEGESVEIGFNSKFLLDTLAQLEETVEIEFTNQQTAALIREAGNTDTFYVMMPMRV